MRSWLLSKSSSPECEGNLSRQLSLDTNSVGGIPHLKNASGEWKKDGKEKADLFAATFASKCVLADIEQNHYSELPTSRSLPPLQGVTVSVVEDVLRDLDADKATGPDLMPSRILKNLADVLAEPVFLLTKQILLARRWPVAWMQHWIVPLHKRKAVSNPSNYRGIHLTPHLSKVVERVLLKASEAILMQLSLFGRNQFAYSKRRGSRDAIAYMVVTWISAFEKRQNVGVFCSDVQGAFDRVSLSSICSKLHSAGLPIDLVGVFCS